jgi:hypothetical protein
MPEVGIVCADATIAEIDGVEAVFEEIAGDDEEVEKALRRILDASRKSMASGAYSTCVGPLVTCSRTTPTSAVHS